MAGRAPAEVVCTVCIHCWDGRLVDVDSILGWMQCTDMTSPSGSPRQLSRPASPNQFDLMMYGYKSADGTWTCNFPGCQSRAVFTRGCDLRKHHKRHTKSFFCRYQGCSQSTGGGFSSKKDLARHEAKHAPSVSCEWDGCGRIFSRVDNMVRLSPSTNNPL